MQKPSSEYSANTSGRRPCKYMSNLASADTWCQASIPMELRTCWDTLVYADVYPCRTKPPLPPPQLLVIMACTIDRSITLILFIVRIYKQRLSF